MVVFDSPTDLDHATPTGTQAHHGAVPAGDFAKGTGPAQVLLAMIAKKPSLVTELLGR